MEKTVWATQQIVFLGMLLDGNKFLLSIPLEKSRKALELLEYVILKRKVTIKQIQSLAGLLNFLNKAVIPGRTFTRSLYDNLHIRDKKGKLLKQHHHTYLTKENVLDCQVWMSFLSGILPERLCRPFTDFHNEEEYTILQFYTDASLNPKFGIGGIFNGQWFSQKWEAGFIETYRPSIEFVELLALVAGVLLWGNQIQNVKCTIFCDNSSVKDIVNGYATKCQYSLKLLRLLVLDNIMHNRKIKVKHLFSEENSCADALSRMDFKKFRRVAPENVCDQPDLIPNEVWPPCKFFN